MEEKNKALGWIDLAAAVLGIGVLFVLLVLGTKWAASRWAHEEMLLYLNGFLTQLSFLLLIWVIKTLRKWNWADFGWRPVRFRQVWPSIIGLYILAWSL
ncbi:MAG: CPBP family intramembrane glutamic endopeptidase, partial [Desulfitobacteriaceae bacterium]